MNNTLYISILKINIYIHTGSYKKWDVVSALQKELEEAQIICIKKNHYMEAKQGPNQN